MPNNNLGERPMMKTKISFISLFVILTVSFAIKAQTPPEPDATVIVRQSTLNGFLAAVGPVSGEADYNVAGAKGKYHWTVTDAKIGIAPGAAKMAANADIKVGAFKYDAPVKGEVSVNYNQEKNLISVKVQKAEFEVYIKLLGKKIHIADVDISKYYKPEFEFAGPQPVQSQVPVTLPDGSVKTIYIKTVDHKMELRQDVIVVSSKVVFSNQP